MSICNISFVALNLLHICGLPIFACIPISKLKYLCTHNTPTHVQMSRLQNFI